MKAHRPIQFVRRVPRVARAARIRPWRVAMVLLASAMLLELAAVGYLRLIASELSFRQYATVGQLQQSSGKQSQVQRHPYLGYSLNPGFQNGLKSINDLGFRGEPVALGKPEGEFRIVCVGGSTTFGGGIDDDSKTYPARLQGILRARGHARVRVINAGVPGYTTFESLGNLQYRVSELEPDLVIVYHAINDLLTRLVWPPRAYRGDNSAFRRPSEQVFMPDLWEYSTFLRIAAIRLGLATPHSRIDRLFGARSEHFVGFDGGAAQGPTIARMFESNRPVYFERNLTTMTDVARRSGAEMLLLTFVHCRERIPEDLRSKQDLVDALEEMNETIRRVARNEATQLFDLCASLPAQPDHFADLVHMNERGTRAQAEQVADFVEANLLPGPGEVALPGAAQASPSAGPVAVQMLDR